MTTENYEQKHGLGHMAAIFTILLWGTTFISTKILLRDFAPAEILIIRFVMGLIALVIAYPKPIRGTTLRQELTFAGAGLSGITLYYLLENIALTHTTASNVSVIASVAPFFTVLLSYAVSRGKEKLRVMYFVGFAIAMTGICMLSFSTTKFQAEPLGDLLALIAAAVWAFYSILTRRISGYGFNTIQVTHLIHDTGMVSYGLSSGAFPVRRSCKSEQHAVSGSGSIGRLLRDVEFRHQTSGCSRIQRLYLCHPADHGHRSCYRAPRAGDGFQSCGDRADFSRSGSFGAEVRQKRYE